MTTEEFREVDDDLLADYLGGALDGTPQHAEIARLVDVDPAWAQAYALLAPALTKVHADLARWADPSPELPPEFADRLAAALAGVPADRNATSADVASPVVVPSQGGGSRRPTEPGPATPTGPGRRRRRWARRGAPVVAVAAVAVVAVGLGLNRSMTNSDTAGTSALTQAEGAAARTTGPTLRSGTNYSPETLGEAAKAGSPDEQRASGSPGEQPRVDAEGGSRPTPTGLDSLARLTAEAALTVCLTDIAAEHRVGPLVFEVIDYAAFQSMPALVVRFTDAAGARWAWVSGPECGLPGSGSDSRYSARVG
ncbi:hypothetical protein V6V47_05975 [Micromonospora sp. CPCC 205539]|uniref:hypothetical protein n=1 Tax=Micromonospora sp. CPCC 205539 TaxID=3122408 RepID=UPI002FEFD4A3